MTVGGGPLTLPDPVRIGPDDGYIAVGVHGRGQSAGYLVEHLIDRLDVPSVGWLLPRSPVQQWYGGRAADPPQELEGELGPSIEAIVGQVGAHIEGIQSERIVWVGFSQGGCVVAEILNRVPGPWAGAAILAGTLTGPAPGDRTAGPSLEGLPVEMGVGDRDEWMPVSSAEATAAVLRAAGAEVRLTVTESDEHVIHDAEIEAVDRLLRSLATGAR